MSTNKSFIVMRLKNPQGNYTVYETTVGGYNVSDFSSFPEWALRRFLADNGQSPSEIEALVQLANEVPEIDNVPAHQT